MLVEKPLATKLSDGHELAELAKSSGLVLMPGHTFIYSPAVNAVRELIRNEVVGDIHFVTSSRMNLGKYQRDGVVCDLAPHDLSILLYWLEQPVVEVSASGSCVFREDVPETAFLTLTFAERHDRQRAALVAGAAQGAADDRRRQQAHGPVRRHRRGRAGACLRPRHGRRPARPTSASTSSIYRSGDVVIPRVDAQEPLRLELQDFAHAIRTGEEPRSNRRARARHRRRGRDGVRVDARERRASGALRAGAGSRLAARAAAGTFAQRDSRAS